MESASKKRLTRDITKFLQDQIDNTDCDEVSQVWGGKTWDVGDFFQASDSLRLRHAGHQLLKFYFEHEEFSISKPLTANDLLVLSRQMNAPFFVSKNNITIYSSELAVMIKIAGGVSEWLSIYR